MSAMRNDVGVLLYRRVLKSLAVVERYGANHIVLGRYAEYIPKSVTVEKNETLNAIARKVFVTTSSGPGSLGTAFSFLKDITESFADMELQALWESYSRKDDYELVEGMAIVSTALHLAGELQPIRSGCLTAAVAKTMDDVHKFLEEMKRVLMDHLCSLQSKRKSVPQSFLLTVINVYIKMVTVLAMRRLRTMVFWGFLGQTLVCPCP
ncbi:hypothetical protein ERJ75_001436000 [Trypanosoma vivax]|nr:hypothetical protein ERJ75_001436000 [Trypanosoma vivax]